MNSKTIIDYLKPFIIVALCIFMWSDYVSADECIKPTSDADLVKYYYICNGGWCLR